MILSIFFFSSVNNSELHSNPSQRCCTEGSAQKPESRLVMRRDECSERIYRGHGAFYLVMLPGLQCAILFFFSHQRMGAEKKTPEIKQTKLIRRQPKDARRDASRSLGGAGSSFPPPARASPRSKHSPPTTPTPPPHPSGLPLSAREKRNTRRWVRGGEGR